MLRTKADWEARFKRLSWMQQFVFRTRYVKLFSFPILTVECAEQLQLLVGARRVLEIGAGTGYLARYLASSAAYYKPIDTKDWSGLRFDKHHSVVLQDARNEDFSQYDCFVLSWPDFHGTLAEEVAERIPVGAILIYQGESSGGCTGTDKFFDLLETHFTPLTLTNELLAHNHIRFEGIHDDWYVYRKI